ncbi:nuclear transcription factor Y subunit gamma isoform X2 [Hydra vulgaris]|uniref:Nuclear transcription factor Y subunit gamma n=1 Tax=Hydra vulgaris TaxID=6087 RepID=A0ABM4BGJ4_HYDVU
MVKPQQTSDAAQLLATFWPRVMNEIRTKPLQMPKSGSKKDEPIQELPLARIKKIMKQDGEVKMISAEAPILFSKAAEIFISELTLRAWIHTEDNKRRTLQRNDIAMAITKYDQFDFLIDIVPREELKPVKRQEDTLRHQVNVLPPEQVQYYFQLSQLQQNASSGSSSQAQIGHLPPGAHIIQQNGQVIIAAQPHQIAALAGAASNIHQEGQQEHHINESDSSHQHQHQSVEQQIIQPTQGTSQIHYIRIPQGALHQGQNLTQILQLQQLQQQQQQHSCNSQSSTENQNNSVSNARQQEAVYSQIYQSIQGLPSGAVYVMAQPTNSQVSGLNQS